MNKILYWRRHAAWHRRPLILGLGVSWFVSASGACRFMLADPLVDLVWSCLILADLGRFRQNLVCLFVDLRKHICKHLSKEGVPKTTTNLLTMRSKLRKIDPTSITDRPKIHQKSIGIDSGKRSVTEAQRGTTVKINIEAFWRHLADFGRNFGPRWTSKGQSARYFSMYFALAKNN